MREGHVLGRFIPTLITRSTALCRLGPSDGPPCPQLEPIPCPPCGLWAYTVGGESSQVAQGREGCRGRSESGGLTHTVDPRDAEQGGGRATEDLPAGQRGGKRRTVGRILMDKSREPKGCHTGPLGCQRTELLQKDKVLSPV